MVIFIFFFSSRRRHTRCLSDWSSDVCSSDLVPPISTLEMSCDGRTFADLGVKLLGAKPLKDQTIDPSDSLLGPYRDPRSEERRVGKESRSRRSKDTYKKEVGYNTHNQISTDT